MLVDSAEFRTILFDLFGKPNMRPGQQKLPNPDVRFFQLFYCCSEIRTSATTRSFQ